MMDCRSDLKRGQVVRSLRGRDKDSILVVLEVLDNSHVLVADGKRRTLDHPKKKKVKHLQAFGQRLELNERKPLLDAHIRKMLKDYQ